MATYSGMGGSAAGNPMAALGSLFGGGGSAKNNFGNTQTGNPGLWVEAPLHSRNLALEIHPVDFTKDPALAGLNDKLVAINATMQIDLLGQCGSESLGSAPHSGTDGQSDFVRAANRSAGGKAFTVLPSTAKGDSISRSVPVLSPGTHVSTSKNDIDYVFTEYGVAQLRGKSARQRAGELIAIAHPAFRAKLTEQARRLKLA